MRGLLSSPRTSSRLSSRATRKKKSVISPSLIQSLTERANSNDPISRPTRVSQTCKKASAHRELIKSLRRQQTIKGRHQLQLQCAGNWRMALSVDQRVLGLVCEVRPRPGHSPTPQKNKISSISGALVKLHLHSSWCCIIVSRSTGSALNQHDRFVMFFKFLLRLNRCSSHQEEDSTR